MDVQSRREWMRGWIALGIREGLSYKQLSRLSGKGYKTLRRWEATFRREAAALDGADRDDRPFVDLIERASARASRIEIVVRGERRIVVDGTAVVEGLVRLLTLLERC